MEEAANLEDLSFLFGPGPVIDGPIVQDSVTSSLGGLNIQRAVVWVEGVPGEWYVDSFGLILVDMTLRSTAQGEVDDSLWYHPTVCLVLIHPHDQRYFIGTSEICA